MEYQSNGFKAGSLLASNLNFSSSYWSKKGENDSSGTQILIRCSGNPGTRGNLDDCQKNGAYQFYMNLDFSCFYKANNNNANKITLHHTRQEEIGLSLQEVKSLSETSIANWCKQRILYDGKCYDVKDTVLSRATFGLK